MVQPTLKFSIEAKCFPQNAHLYSLAIFFDASANSVFGLQILTKHVTK